MDPAHQVKTAGSLSEEFQFARLCEAVGKLRDDGIVPGEVLAKRAAWLKQDLDKLAWDKFAILPTQWLKPPQTGLLHALVEYEWGQTDFDNNKHKNPFEAPKNANCIEGSGASRESLSYFSKVSQIGHTLIPHLWLDHPKLLRDVRELNQHLNTLNEVWWLD